MLAPARCSAPPARQSILCTPTLPCIPLAFTAHDTELCELLCPAPLRSTEYISFCHHRLEFPVQLSLTTPAAVKKENSSDFSNKGIFPPALRLVAGWTPGNVTHTVFPLHLPAMGNLDFQT